MSSSVMSSTARSASAVRVPLPVFEVEVPLTAAADAGSVRQLGGALAAVSDRFGAAAWRLDGSAAALSGGLGWCGPASSAYLGACADARGWLLNAWSALGLAGTTCGRYADELEQAAGLARAAAATARRLEAERSRLVEQVRRVDERLASAPSSGAGSLTLFTGLGAEGPEINRLQAWADQLAHETMLLRSQVDAVEQACRTADARAAAAFDRVASMTQAARSGAVEAARAAQPPDPSVPVEDGSLGSRIGGFFSALGDDITQPVAGLVGLGGLVGLNGDLSDSWSALGHGIAEGLTHPVETGKALIDWSDIEKGDWGHWAGTVGPGAAATVASLGGYSAVRVVSSLGVFERADTVAAEVRRLADLADHADIARIVAANGGHDTSVLVQGGGLLAHELAGGHSIDRHVGLSVEQLRQRMKRYRNLYVASTFVDRSSAERLVAQTLDAKSAEIALWLADREKNIRLSASARDVPALKLTQDMGEQIGMSLRRGAAVPTASSVVRVVLVYDDSPLGFHVETAFPLR